jgi:hypothetical protein
MINVATTFVLRRRNVVGRIIRSSETILSSIHTAVQMGPETFVYTALSIIGGDGEIAQ